MGVITAKYAGNCCKCGGNIEVGEKCNWESRKIWHLECPEMEETPYRLSGGSGYGCEGWDKGEVVRASKYQIENNGFPDFLFVVSSGKQYHREEGMSFGVGDEDGYTYWAKCRAATDAESAELRQKIEIARLKRQAKADLDAIENEIRETGERPEGPVIPEGDRWFDTQNIYGGGSWFVVGPEWIWFVRNNGMDGDDWSRNNVRTGGAGAIGWRVPRDEELISRLSAIKAVLQ